MPPDDYLEYLRERRRRFLILLTVLAPAFAGVALLAYTSVLEAEVPFFFRTYRLAAYGAIGMAIAGALMLYLQRGASAFLGRSRENGGVSPERLFESFSQLERRQAAAIHSLRSQLDEVRQQISAPRPVEFGPDERQSALNTAVEAIKAQAGPQLLEELRRELLAAEASREKHERLDTLFISARERLQAEVASLNRRGNLNLVLGIMTTAAGLVVLGVVVFRAGEFHGDVAPILSYFIPRISLALFIELFAYFFLNLYRQSLGEIKYFQNELTNLEQRLAAVRVTLQVGDEQLRRQVLVLLAKTERNFVLSKGQTTVELDSRRLDAKSVDGVIAAARAALGESIAKSAKRLTRRSS